MKIICVSAIILRLPHIAGEADGTQDTCLIKVETDAGITGWGEVETSPTVAKAAVEALESHELSIGLASAIEGMDPLAVNDCMTRMEMASGYFAGSGSGLHAMAGINVALWDVVGKAYDLPIYRLFGGGSKTKIRAYASTLFGNTPAETYDRASRYADMGFTALKLGWGPMGGSRDGDIALVREGRRGVGEDIDLMIDAGQPWNWRTALDRANDFAAFNPFWIEEPLHHEDIDGYARLAVGSPIPIAGGEREATYGGFQRYIVEGGVDWIQADPGRCGISLMVEVGRMAARHRVGFVNHSFKTGISIAASLHVLASVPRGNLLEYAMTDSPLRHELTHEKFEVVEGMVSVPDGPGLGITVDETTVEKYACP